MKLELVSMMSLMLVGIFGSNKGHDFSPKPNSRQEKKIKRHGENPFGGFILSPPTINQNSMQTRSRIHCTTCDRLNNGLTPLPQHTSRSYGKPLHAQRSMIPFYDGSYSGDDILAFA